MGAHNIRKTNFKGQISDPIKIERVQGCPLSPLLFALAIEPLAIEIRCKEAIKGICIRREETKIALYADDIVCFLTQPSSALAEMDKIIKHFGLISGYKINNDKSTLLGINITDSLKQAISETTSAKWASDTVTYLGVKISKNYNKMTTVNINPVITYIQECCDLWSSYKLSWLGKVAAVKMVLLPKLLFLFLNAFLDVPIKTLQKIRSIFSKFIWNSKKLRMKLSTVEKKV